MVGISNVSYLQDRPGYNYSEPEDAFEIPTADGGVVIQFGKIGHNGGPELDDDFYQNLADKVDPSTLGSLAHELLDGIQADETSRSQWIADRTRGLDLLAIKVETPRADIGGSGAPLDGMSTVRHPLLLEACIKFQSNSKREMLPPNGPVKIKTEGRGSTQEDMQAEKLGDLLNRYFTEFSPEYYPDTDRMFFDEGFSGTAFKKVFHCPLRRRPVSDTVQGKDLIVSNDATDLRTAQRVTHQITMTRATLKRMQWLGAYSDVSLNRPDDQPQNTVTAKQQALQGLQKSHRPQDLPYTLYECYTQLDLRGFEHEEDGQATGLPLPYKVTIDRASRQILEIRRNWEESSKTFEPRRVFIAYSFVPMFGFYATGLLHILGNATQAVTGAWRVLLDSGMFSNFPGFLYAKSGGRQMDLNFRVPPGGGAPVDLNGAEDIRKTVMPLPYKEPGAATMQLVDNIVATGQRVGGAANMLEQDKVRQNMPVGTTMALIEQAAQTIGAVHERNYMSQAHEFQQLLTLIREDPEALWRFIEDENVWTYDELIQTLANYTLVPVADPNTPTHVHRIMKMTTLKQLADENPDIYDIHAVDRAILLAMKFDNPDQFFAPPPPPGATPPDPAVIVAQTVKETKMADIQAKMQLELAKLQHAKSAQEIEASLEVMRMELDRTLKTQSEETKLVGIQTTAQTKAEDRDSKEAIEGAKLHNAGLEREHASQEGQVARADAGMQAGADRQHTAQMKQTELQHKSGEAGYDREHTAGEADKQRMADGGEAKAAREHETGMAIAQRQHESRQSAADRVHTRSEAGKDRKHAEGVNKAKLDAQSQKPPKGK